jgi:hypothetical protein
MASDDVSRTNRENAKTARALYVASRDPSVDAGEWREALRLARGQIADMLRASNYMMDPAKALEISGKHMIAIRQLMAPPMSQDQFALMCPEWKKGTEKQGRLTSNLAVVVAQKALEWIDHAGVPWVAGGRQPTRAELRNTLQRGSVLIALQKVQTLQRTRLSFVQESAVLNLLVTMGWERKPSRLISDLSTVAPKSFMHKTRFATKTRPQEVDVACGLKGTIVAAIECKVTNDETNSVKRINDVVKKANAWHNHWGSFVETVAVLQGVIKPGDVDRLSEANVHVFWSHDLEALRSWLDTKV